MSGNLVKRIAFSVVAIPLALAVVWWGGWPMAGVLALLGVLGTREVYDLARRQGIEALPGLGYPAAALIPVAAYWAKGSELHWAEPALFLGALWLLAVLTAAMTARGPQGRPLAAVAVTVFGALYASALLSFLIAIRHGGAGGGGTVASAAARSWLVILPLGVTWICDTCAMAAGAAFGGPKLAPALSPQKTWSGAIGGTLGGLVAALVIGLLILPRVGVHFGVWQLAAVGFIVAVVGQLGDVAESLFKREAGVKDSSALIPGHGGVLDRLDSLYFVIPVSAGVFKLLGFA